ncbi:hypothetical protein HP532_25630 [Pseudomonas sp. CrR25]|nr:hypothetical protein [Pseudomonas sp. CrR25]
MSMFTQSFTIVNNSAYSLTLLDESNQGDGDWPKSIPANSTTPVFVQTGRLSVNPTVTYGCDGANPAISITMHFYCMGLAPLLTANMYMTFSSETPFNNSSIYLDNNFHDGATATYPPQNPLTINTTGNGSSTGQAIFTVGTSN